MLTKSSLLTFLAVFIFTMSQARNASHNNSRIKVLIVDGFSNHDWQETTRVVIDLLDDTGLFEVSVSTAPPTVA